MTQIIECSSNERKASTIVDLEAVKARQQIMWASGDFAVIGTTLQIVGETLCEALDLESGSRVLDVACGNGNAALAAARRWCRVTGLDYVPLLLRRAGERAQADGLSLELVEGDAERLPFDDATFDAGLSTFGIMFAPDQEQAARELLRVCRPGGRVGLASWTPEGFVGQWFQLTARYAAPPPGIKPPLRWGTEAGLQELFGRRMRLERRMYGIRYRSAQEWLDFFRRKGVTGNGSSPHPPGDVVVGGAETVEYILERARATGEEYLPEQVHAVIETQLAYLRAIGAVGPRVVEIDPHDPPDAS